MLPTIPLTAGPGKVLVLKIPKRYADLLGERVEKRLSVLAGQLGRIARIDVG
jgi:exopolyphosphatase / guanosine-5'-triphosphate,3'-diphosphate pyrophosphatase